MLADHHAEAAIVAMAAQTGHDVACCRARVNEIAENDFLNIESGELAADYIRPLELFIECAADLDCTGNYDGCP